MRAVVVIPFRDRGIDPRRTANLDVVTAWWWSMGFEMKVRDDGLEGDAQFNRHRAYNRAVTELTDYDMFIFSEADMLIPPIQVVQAIMLARTDDGLVVPFTQYRYLSDETTSTLRDVYYDSPERTAQSWSADPRDQASVFQVPAESIREDGRSVGAVNVISRETIEKVGGFSELTSGNWYDDRVTEEGYAFLSGPTRFVRGPAVHLYHLPGWSGDHLTKADTDATATNKAVLAELRVAVACQGHKAVREIMRARV